MKLGDFSQIIWDIFLANKELSFVLLFSRGGPFVYECSANFRSLFAHF